MAPAPIIVHQDAESFTAPATTSGIATGVLLGGNLDMLRTSVGWACPSFEGAILFIEAIDMLIGAIDRALTQLARSGVLDGVLGVAVGQFIRAGEGGSGKWSAVDVVLGHLEPLGVPVLGGLPLGHGPNPITFAVGVPATIDVSTRTLTVDPGLR
jgi:muramoyltetrapeptide carboxypeptidase